MRLRAPLSASCDPPLGFALVDIEQLTARIGAAFDQAVTLRADFHREAEQKMSTPGSEAEGFAAQIAASAHGAVVRALAVILDREVPDLPD